MLWIQEPPERGGSGCEVKMKTAMISETRLEFSEPERYELSEAPKYQFELNRREFVQILGAGVLVSVVAPGWVDRPGGWGAPVASCQGPWTDR